MVKKKFKKVIKWSYEKNLVGIVPSVLGLLVIMIPILSNIQISFDNYVSSRTSIGYYIIGGVFLFASLILFIWNINKETYYEEV